MHAGVNDPLDWRIMPSITLQFQEESGRRLVEELINFCYIIICINYIVSITSYRQSVNTLSIG